MALPVVLFHASSGSDTQASGAGPGTAIFGTGASINGTTSIDLSADAPDLSGVAVDGSAVLWVNTTSGRKFFKITNTNNTTKIVTVANSATGTESGRTWAIGGKRATLDAATSRVLLTADVLPGWTIRIENGGGTQTINTSALAPSISGDTTTGAIILEGDSATTMSVISQASNAACLAPGAAGYWKIRNLKFQCTNGTRTNAYGINFGSSLGWWEIDNCVFGDSTNKLLIGIGRSGGTITPIFIRDCAIEFCTSAGVFALGGVMWCIDDCTINDCTGAGIDAAIDYLLVDNCIIEANGGDGIAVGRNGGLVIVDRCTIDGNSGDGLDASANIQVMVRCQNTIFSNNANYGIRAASGQSALQAIDYCNFYSNTSGARLNVNAGTNDLALDPTYTDRSNRDFSIGTNLKAAGHPGTRYVGANQSATRSYVDIGAAQRQEAGGSGGRACIIGG